MTLQQLIIHLMAAMLLGMIIQEKSFKLAINLNPTGKHPGTDG